MTLSNKINIDVNPKKTFITNGQLGYTLVELMIAMVIGLLISAAALQIFLTSSQNARRQQASSQIQDHSIFGLSELQMHLRRANYGARSGEGNSKYFMNHLTPQGGVVLTAPNGTGTTSKWGSGNLYGLVWGSTAIPNNLLSHNASTGSSSNLLEPTNSDQLTIQYKAGRAGMFDCQGRVIPHNFYVIERYFVRRDTSVSPSRNGLACASAIYDYDEASASSDGIDISRFVRPHDNKSIRNNLTGNGMIIIPNTDYFRVLLGVSNTSGFATNSESARVAYIPIPDSDKVDTTLADMRIVGVQVGLLTHSDEPTANLTENSELRFKILDKSNVLLNKMTQDEPSYLRNVSETAVLFRNARGGV